MVTSQVVRNKHPKNVLQWSGIMGSDLDDETWSVVACHLAPALTPMDTLVGVRKAIESTAAQLWAIWEGRRCIGAIVTRIEAHDNGNVFIIAQCGGSQVRLWMPYFPSLEAYAREADCVKIIIVGREGWLKILPGFVKTGVVLEKKL